MAEYANALNKKLNPLQLAAAGGVFVLTPIFDYRIADNRVHELGMGTSFFFNPSKGTEIQSYYQVSQYYPDSWQNYANSFLAHKLCFKFNF
jgi:hypothetical protein